MSEKRQKAHLEDWYFGGSVLGHGVLYGIVSGHPNSGLPDGTWVHTSYLLKPLGKNPTKAKTKNTDYTLGKRLVVSNEKR